MSSGIDKTSKPAAKRGNGCKRPSAVDVLAKTDAAAKQKAESPKRARRTKDQVVVDRRRLTRMMNRNVSRTAMAETLGISPTRLNDEIQAINRQLETEGITDVRLGRLRMAAQLDEIFAEAFEAWEQSKYPIAKASREKGIKGDKDVDVLRTETATQGSQVVDGVSQSKPGNPGDPRFLKQAMDALVQKAALLGLNMPTKVAPTTPDGLEPYTPGVSIDDFAAVLDAAREYEKTRAAQEQFERLATGKANAATNGS